jgi:hypothetical protein
MPSTSDIEAFWRFFARSAGLLAENLDNQSAQAELDAEVTKLGPFGWEIGPGRQRAYSLAFSPNGDENLLRAAREIVAMAPDVPDWELHPAKPPKQWDLRLAFEVNEKSVSVDARPWRYVLLDYGDGVLDLTLEAPDLASLDEEVRAAVAEVVVEGILGEECRIERIGTIDVVAKLAPDEDPDGSPISVLAKHVAALLAGELTE